MKFSIFALIVAVAFVIMHTMNYFINTYNFDRYIKSRIEYHNTHRTQLKANQNVHEL